MSEELDNKVNEIDNSQETKKKTYRKKENSVTEQYQYKNEEELELITDKPSLPLIKNDDNKNDLVIPVVDDKSLNVKIEKNIIMRSNKELYESYIKDLKYFSLILNGEVIYDSSIDKSKDFVVKFENDFFILYGKKYSYNGLKIQKISIR